MTALRPPLSDFALYPAIAAICLLAAVLSGMSAFGSGLIISAAVAPSGGVETIVPLVPVVMMVAKGARISAFAQALDQKHAGILLSTSIPAFVPGAIVHVQPDSEMIAVVLGLVLIASAPVNRWLRKRRFKVGSPTLAGLGAAFGLLSSNISGAGPMIPPIRLGAGLLAPAVLATGTAIALGSSTFRMTTFGALNALTVPIAAAGLLMRLRTIPGTWVSATIMKRTSLHIRTAVIETFVVIAGLTLLWRRPTAP